MAVAVAMFIQPNILGQKKKYDLFGYYIFITFIVEIIAIIVSMNERLNACTIQNAHLTANDIFSRIIIIIIIILRTIRANIKMSEIQTIR